jgi:hexulose-6-phosphate isomerase
MKKGINGWAFERGTDWGEAAGQASRAGFEVFEPTMDETGQITPEATEAQCRQASESINSSGMEIASLATGLFWSKPLTSPDASVRQEAMDLALAGLDRAAWIGAPVFLLVPGMVSHFARPTELLVPYADAMNRAYDALCSLASEAEDRGVVIAVENVWNQMLLSPVEFQGFIDRINSPWVQVYLDVGNVLKFGFPQDWIQTLGQRIARIHVKDFKLHVGTLEGFCLPGDGDVDFPAVLRALQAIRYEGPLVYEGRGDLADIAARMQRITADA